MKNINLIRTRGGSMRPVFGPGREVIFSKRPVYGAGDAVLYRLEGKYYLHRISLRSNGRYLMKDDSGIIDGHWVDGSCVKGRAERGPHGIAGQIWGNMTRYIYREGRVLKGVLSRIHL